MLEHVSSPKKQKVSLSEYHCEQDIQNRMLLADCSSFDLEAIEEILFSPLKISLKKLARQLECEEKRLLILIQKLSKAGLTLLDGDLILVDKEMRKYFEFQWMRFQSDFKPDLEYIHGILRKVPIHVLPGWYSIPRTTNNIFESIVEKYLFTPHIYQRSVHELAVQNPLLDSIIRDLMVAPDFTLTSSDVIAKYNLTRRSFEETLLFLEFHFVCCICYRKEEDDHWVEVVTPFYEWHQHLRFLRRTEAPLITGGVVPSDHRDFAFIEEMSDILASIQRKKKPFDKIVSVKMAEKLCLIGLAAEVDGFLVAEEDSEKWLDMSLENRALHLYRHPLNKLPIAPTQAHVREAEKAIKRVLHGEWVYFEDFIKGALVAVSEKTVVVLKKTGKHWKYELPNYTAEDKALIHDTIFEFLFEVGMVKKGHCGGRECFCVTAFGRFLFEE